MTGRKPTPPSARTSDLHRLLAAIGFFTTALVAAGIIVFALAMLMAGRLDAGWAWRGLAAVVVLLVAVVWLGSIAWGERVSDDEMDSSIALLRTRIELDPPRDPHVSPFLRRGRRWRGVR